MNAKSASMEGDSDQFVKEEQRFAESLMSGTALWPARQF